MRFALEASHVGIWEADFRSGVTFWSETCERMHGLAPGGFDGTDAQFLETVHPEDRSAIQETVERAKATGVAAELEYRTRWPDGSVHWLISAGRFFYDPSGTAVRGAGVMIDVTERRSLEEQLRQAQKMEAVGQLAGGIAHDFNNMLTAILGNAEFLKDALPLDDPCRADVDEITKAADARGGADASAARVQPQAGAGAARAPRRRHRQRDHADAAPAARRDDRPQDDDERSRPCESRQRPARTGADEPGGQRARRDAGRRTPHHRDRRRRAGRGVRAAAPGRDAGHARHGGRQRHGPRHGPGDAGAHLRAVLHHQAGGARHRPRPGDRARHRQPERRTYLGLQRSGARHDLQAVPAAHRRGGRRPGQERRSIRARSRASRRFSSSRTKRSCANSCSRC